MKKRIASLLFAVLFLCLSVVPALAATSRASDQIHGYEITVTPQSGGKIKITFHVEGNAEMDELGAEEITIYRHSGSNWVEVDYYDRNDPDMTRQNTGFCRDSVVFQGTSGAEYKVVVTIFAEDSYGYDSRTKTYIVTAK